MNSCVFSGDILRPVVKDSANGHKVLMFNLSSKGGMSLYVKYFCSPYRSIDAVEEGIHAVCSGRLELTPFGLTLIAFDIEFNREEVDLNG